MAQLYRLATGLEQPSSACHATRSTPPRHPGRRLAAGRAAAAAARRLAAAAGRAEDASAASSSADLGALAGVWLKDAAATDAAAYERTLDLLGLSGLQKTTALALIEGLELSAAGGGCVRVRFLTVVPFFQIAEVLDLGAPVELPRRDLRPGAQRAEAALRGGALVVDSAWGAPSAGALRETYALLGDGDGKGDRLAVDAELRVGGATAAARQVFRRADAWRPRHRWNPLAMLLDRGGGG